MRRERDNAKVSALLDRLVAVAKDERENIMPVTIELVAAGASMGDIVESLKGAVGNVPREAGVLTRRCRAAAMRYDSTMRMLIPYLDFAPSVAAPMECAPTAAIVGRTVAGPGLVLRDYATLRADGEWVRVGANAYFGERATVHIADGTLAANIGDDVTVGRFALVHACTRRGPRGRRATRRSSWTTRTSARAR